MIKSLHVISGVRVKQIFTKPAEIIYGMQRRRGEQTFFELSEFLQIGKTFRNTLLVGKEHEQEGWAEHRLENGGV